MPTDGGGGPMRDLATRWAAAEDDAARAAATAAFGPG
jgi:hypothetical protein